MNSIFKCGLVAALLICGAMSVVVGQDEVTYSEDFRDGFYQGAMVFGQVNNRVINLYHYYVDLGGVLTEDNAEYVADYNNQTTEFNQVWVPNINAMVLDIFGAEDNRTQELLLSELPLIS